MAASERRLFGVRTDQTRIFISHVVFDWPAAIAGRQETRRLYTETQNLKTVVENNTETKKTNYFAYSGALNTLKFNVS
jgi:hypothetical protein